MQIEAWPTEDWQLVRSLVDSELPEDDLFAGLAESAPGSGNGARPSRRNEMGTVIA